MVTHDPNHVAYVRGEKKYTERRYSEAAQYFLLALEEWPEDWMSMHALGDCYSEMKRPRKAEKYFRLALQVAPQERRADLIYNLGNALFDQGRYDEAIEQYRQVPCGHKIAQLAANNISACQVRLGR